MKPKLAFVLVSFLCALTFVLALPRPTFAQSNSKSKTSKEVYTGTIVGIGGRLGGITQTFSLTIEGYTSDEDTLKFLEILKSAGQDELLKAISKEKKGSIQVGGQVGRNVNFVRISQDEEGEGNDMKRSLTMILVAVLFVGLFIVQPALGQWNYNRRLTKSEVGRVIKGLEEATDEFKKVFDKEIDKTRLDGTRTEDRLWEKVKDLERATDRLRNRFDRTDSWWETRSEVQDVMKEARGLNGVIRGFKMPVRMKASWQTVRLRINALAKTYDLPALR
ncbi:MAG: hypothetical protein MOB07_06450 [Acidobacteria bacterium]|nr:hypothetical protein [Acidobacteriota bacterium]